MSFQDFVDAECLWCGESMQIPLDADGDPFLIDCPGCSRLAVIVGIDKSEIDEGK